MSEWLSVLAVFWVLWVIDGLRHAPRRIFTFRLRPGARANARATFARLSWPAWLPFGARIVAAEVPLTFSPLGVCNQPAGSAGRPAETPLRRQAWRWGDVREVGVAGGWIFVNGERFCPDTGHVSAPQLLAIARLPAAQREAPLRRIVASWFRVATVRRRTRALAGRTRVVATLNAVTLALLAALTIYVVADAPSRVPAEWTERLVFVVAGWVALIFGLHVAAVLAAYRALRRLQPVTAQKRGANLLSAALLPPQALRLRGLLGEGFFPAQHPLGVALAVAGPRTVADCAFAALADLRWPLPEHTTEPLAEEIRGWFQAALEKEVTARLAAVDLAPATLLAPPRPDAPASCAYCPRCRDQFVAGRTVCPHGIALQPLRRP